MVVNTNYTLDEAADAVVTDDNQFGDFQYGTGFSHESHVSLAYTKAINAGAKEMRRGYWQTKTDRTGNVMQIYEADTRLEFIETIKTLYSVMINDLDKQARDAIKVLFQKAFDIKKNFSEQEKMEIMKMPIGSRPIYIDGALNQEFPFYHACLDYQVEIYREIMRQLESALGRGYYLKKKINSA